MSDYNRREVSSFRLRGFQCQVCHLMQEVFGVSDPAPVTCACGSAKIKMTFDRLVTVQKTVEDYAPNGTET